MPNVTATRNMIRVPYIFVREYNRRHSKKATLVYVPLVFSIKPPDKYCRDINILDFNGDGIEMRNWRIFFFLHKFTSKTSTIILDTSHTHILNLFGNICCIVYISLFS